MLSLSLLLAFILSFALPEWRDKLLMSPLRSYTGWLIRTFSLQDSGWLPVALILPLLLLINLLDEFFDGILFLLVFTYIAWAVIDVQSIAEDSDETSGSSVFERVNEGLFCGALWFVLVHPLAGVGYRLMVWLSDNEQLSGHDEWSPTLQAFRKWLEWPATFVSGVFVSLAGKVRNGFRQLMLFPILADDMQELNRARVTRVAEAALGDEITDHGARQAAARQLVIRGFLFALAALWLLEMAL